MALAERAATTKRRWQQETIVMAERAGLRDVVPVLTEDLRATSSASPAGPPGASRRNGMFRARSSWLVARSP
jgi:hypothetical protein